MTNLIVGLSENNGLALREDGKGLGASVLIPPAKNAAERIEAAIREILLALGEDVEREGLKETPKRVAKMYLEVFSGLNEDPFCHVAKQFSADAHEEVVIVKDVRFHTMCEHHLLPFFGKAHIAYLPAEGRLTGLSKLARTVATLSKRPQLQERLTAQIADVIESVLSPRAVLVFVEATHMCMAMRGVRADNSQTRTLTARGLWQSDQAARAEVLALLRD